MNANTKTKVLFRMFKGEVLALFPGEAGTSEPWTCSSYAHIGQHAAADYRFVMRSSRPAMHCEFIDLYRELLHVGYRLQIVKRTSAADASRRCKQLAA